MWEGRLVEAVEAVTVQYLCFSGFSGTCDLQMQPVKIWMNMGKGACRFLD